MLSPRFLELPLSPSLPVPPARLGGGQASLFEPVQRHHYGADG